MASFSDVIFLPGSSGEMTILPSLLYTMFPNESLSSSHLACGRARLISAMISPLHTPVHLLFCKRKKGFSGGSTDSALLSVREPEKREK